MCAALKVVAKGTDDARPMLGPFGGQSQNHRAVLPRQGQKGQPFTVRGKCGLGRHVDQPKAKAVGDKAADEVISLPMHPYLEASAIYEICATLKGIA